MLYAHKYARGLCAACRRPTALAYSSPAHAGHALDGQHQRCMDSAHWGISRSATATGLSEEGGRVPGNRSSNLAALAGSDRNMRTVLSQTCAGMGRVRQPHPPKLPDVKRSGVDSSEALDRISEIWVGAIP